MVLFSVLGQLLPALADLPGVSPAALLAVAAGVVLVVALRGLRPQAGDGHADNASVPEPPPGYARIPVRSTDPDAPGRSRPRAPSA